MPVKVGPDPADPYDIVYFKSAGGTLPAQAFLDSCPPGVKAQIRAVLIAVAAAPPPRFAGGGKWEAMHGDMTGYHEVRVDGPGRTHYRLFCKLDSAPPTGKPRLVALDGDTKVFQTKFPKKVYTRVLAHGAEYEKTRAVG